MFSLHVVGLNLQLFGPMGGEGLRFEGDGCAVLGFGSMGL